MTPSCQKNLFGILASKNTFLQNLKNAVLLEQKLDRGGGGENNPQAWGTPKKPRSNRVKVSGKPICIICFSWLKCYLKKTFMTHPSRLTTSEQRYYDVFLVFGRRNNDHITLCRPTWISNLLPSYNSKPNKWVKSWFYHFRWGNTTVLPTFQHEARDGLIRCCFLEEQTILLCFMVCWI